MRDSLGVVPSTARLFPQSSAKPFVLPSTGQGGGIQGRPATPNQRMKLWRPGGRWKGKGAIVIGAAYLMRDSLASNRS